MCNVQARLSFCSCLDQVLTKQHWWFPCKLSPNTWAQAYLSNTINPALMMHGLIYSHLVMQIPPTSDNSVSDSSIAGTAKSKDNKVLSRKLRNIWKRGCPSYASMVSKGGGGGGVNSNLAKLEIPIKDNNRSVNGNHWQPLRRKFSRRQ